MTNIVRPWPDLTIKLLLPPRIIFGKDRILYVRGLIDQMTMEVSPEGPIIASDDICDDLLLLDREGSDPIKMVIHSPGGTMREGFNVIDTMNGLRSPVWTLVRSSSSFGSLLAISGAKGHRYILPTAVLHLHDLSGMTGGKRSDMKETFKYMEHLGDLMIDLLIAKTDLIKKVKQIKAEISAIRSNGENAVDGGRGEGRRRAPADKAIQQRDAKRQALMHWLETERFFTAEEAIEMGLVDHVLTPQLQREFFNIPDNS